MKYTKALLGKMENLLAETPYILRYEKGQFQSGYCVLKESKVILINKFLPPPGRMMALEQIIIELEIEEEGLSEGSLEVLQKLKPGKLQ
jgi:hypothetical protein